MFQPRAVAATMPAQDFERAKSFYSEKLGLTPVREGPGEAVYDVNGMEFVIFPSSGKASGDHTQMGFEVDDLDGAVSSLRDRGVAFEEYDMPDFKTVNGIVEVEGERGAWFKDSEGNLISLFQSTSS
jgi:catechol 2,3-dioxygenase-like lactoylglutathione lyase family enzyme